MSALIPGDKRFANHAKRRIARALAAAGVQHIVDVVQVEALDGGWEPLVHVETGDAERTVRAIAEDSYMLLVTPGGACAIKVPA